MAFQKGSSTNYKTLLDDLVSFCTSNNVTGATVNAGGTGYTVGDILTCTGGTFSFAAKLKVTTVSSGVITGIKVEENGAYTVNPSNPVSVTGGTGSGATFNLTLASTGWTALRNTAPSEKEVILRGVGLGGTDNIYVGIRTFQDTGTSGYNWELAGFTGYSSGNVWGLQPGISNGRHENSEGGSFVLLDNATISWWFFVNARRIIMVAKIGSTYEWAILGFYDAYATSTENPYPLVIGGSCSAKDTRYTSTRAAHSCFGDPRGKGGLSYSTMQVRFTDGIWWAIENSTENSGAATTTRSIATSRPLIPTGRHGEYFSASSYNRNNGFIANNPSFRSDTFKNTTNDTPTYQMRTISGSQPVGIRIPLMFLFTSPSYQLVGEIPDTFWCPVYGTSITDEDILTEGSNEYIVFRNTYHSTENQRFCIKKA